MKTRTEVNEKDKLAKTTAKKDFRQLDKLQFLQNLICLCSWFCFSAKHLTVGVTCAGAGTAKPSNQKNDKACKTA
ncbi:MAG: hypothetical protein AABZ00_00480 [Chloroflexota bacterium]